MCLGANVVRFLLISWISNPWMILPLQAVQGCVLATVWASATSYISLVSPDHLKPTSQYILCLLYHGLAKGIGPIIGGIFINSIGMICFKLTKSFFLFNLTSLNIYFFLILKIYLKLNITQN